MKKIMQKIFVVLLIIDLICNVIFLLPSLNCEMAHIIYDTNPVTRYICLGFDDLLPPFICMVISLVNIVLACMGLRYEYRSGRKKLCLCWVYAIFSLCVFILNCLTFNYIFSCLVAG